MCERFAAAKKPLTSAGLSPKLRPVPAQTVQNITWRLNTLNSGRKFGEVSEWLKEHAWKVCIRQRIEGSNPSLTAKLKNRPQGRFFAFGLRRYTKHRGGEGQPPPQALAYHSILFHHRYFRAILPFHQDATLPGCSFAAMFTSASPHDPATRADTGRWSHVGILSDIVHRLYFVLKN